MSTLLRLTGGMRQVDSDRELNSQYLQVGRREIPRTTRLEAVGTMSVPTSAAEDIPIGSVSSPGYATFLNLDKNNYCQVGFTASATFYPCFWLAPNDFAIVPLWPSVTWQALAENSELELQYAILQREP